MWMERGRDIGDEYSTGSCAYGLQYTTQAECKRFHGDIKREDSVNDVQQLSEFTQEALLGKSFLESGLFC